MFTELYSTIFPELGRIFGILSGLASMPLNDFLGILQGTLFEGYWFTNIFTGERFLQTISGFGGFVGGLIKLVVKWFIPDFLLPYPTWTALLFLSLTTFLGIYVIKYFLDFIRG